MSEISQFFFWKAFLRRMFSNDINYFKNYNKQRAEEREKDITTSRDYLGIIRQISNFISQITEDLQ